MMVMMEVPAVTVIAAKVAVTGTVATAVETAVVAALLLAMPIQVPILAVTAGLRHPRQNASFQ